MKLWTDCHVNSLASVLLLIMARIDNRWHQSSVLKINRIEGDNGYSLSIANTHSVYVNVCNHANIYVSLIRSSNIPRELSVCTLFCAVFELRIYGFHSILCYLNLIMSQYEHFYFFFSFFSPSLVEMGFDCSEIICK